MGKNLDELGYNNEILDKTLKAKSMKETADQLNFIKIKNSCSIKDNVKRMRRQVTDQKKTFTKDTSDKGYYPKYAKNS